MKRIIVLLLLLGFAYMACGQLVCGYEPEMQNYIFSLGGELLRTYPISAFGNGSVQISGSTFTAGMYIYSLVVDGNIVDNKRMILTK